MNTIRNSDAAAIAVATASEPIPQQEKGSPVTLPAPDGESPPFSPLAHKCPLCRQAPGHPCRQNYGKGAITGWPHLERIRRARPRDALSAKSEDVRRLARVQLEEKVLRAVGRLAAEAIAVDNAPADMVTKRIIARIAEVVSKAPDDGDADE